MTCPWLALSLMPETPWLRGALPALEAGIVDALEWSFDCDWESGAIPEWVNELLEAFGERNRVLGHGVSYSILSVDAPYHSEWLERFRRECGRRAYVHVSEHFGLMRTRNFHRGAPLPVPYDPHLVALAGARLRELGAIAQCPVGLENLALAFSLEDVRMHARFLTEILAAADGFVLLDLHNLLCQSLNFEIPLEELVLLYPADRVREIHLSGGSWTESRIGAEARRIRRDTHDSAIPEELFTILPWALANLPNVRAVTIEQMSASLHDDAAAHQFDADIRRVRSILGEGEYGGS